MKIFDINVTLDHPLYPRESTPEALMKTLDTDGVDRAVITNLRPLADLDFDRANEKTSELIRKNPTRLVGFGAVNPLREDQVTNAISKLKLRGIRLSPNFMWIEYSKRVEENIGKAVKLGAIIYVGVTPERPSNMKACAEIAAKFPETKVIIGQIWVPYTWTEVLVLAKHFDNIYLEAGFVMTRILEDAARSIGAPRLLFGSGMPFARPKALAEGIQASSLSDHEKNLILFENAHRMMG